MEKKTKKEVIHGYGVYFIGEERLFTATTGLGVFDHKAWAEALAKHIGSKYTKVIPCTITYTPPKNTK